MPKTKRSAREGVGAGAGAGAGGGSGGRRAGAGAGRGGGRRTQGGANRSRRRSGTGKSARAVRMLKKREPQLVEGEKNTLTLRGPTSSEMMNVVLKNLAMLRKPAGKALTRKNPIRPFEDLSSLEFLAEKNDCSQFAYVSHSKKRPNNLVLGRMYDHHVLDMVEFGVDSFRPGFKKSVGSKPLMVFIGDEFEHDDQLSKVKDVLLDFFRGRPATEVCLAGIDHLIQVTYLGGRVTIRTYSVRFKKSGTKVPKVVLYDMGPHLDLSVRRTQFAAPDMFNLARRQPKAVMPTKRKNVTVDAMGDKIGRVHMTRQDFNQLKTRKLRGLKKRFTPAPEATGAGAGAGEGTNGPSASKRQRTEE